MKKRTFRTVKKVLELKTSHYQGALVKCYKCHSPEVSSVCHHCGRFMCSTHEAHPKLSEDHTYEFRPMLSGDHWKGAHCEEHRHYLFSPLKAMGIPAVVLTILGIILGVYALSVLISIFTRGSKSSLILIMGYLGLLGISVICVVGGVIQIKNCIKLHSRQFSPRADAVRLETIPIVPEEYSIIVQDIVDLDMVIDESSSQFVVASSGEGTVSIGIRVSDGASKAIKQYRDKCSKYGWSVPRNVSIGFLAINDLTNCELIGPPLDGPAANLFTLSFDNELIARSLEVNEQIQVRIQKYQITPAAMNSNTVKHISQK